MNIEHIFFGLMFKNLFYLIYDTCVVSSFQEYNMFETFNELTMKRIWDFTHCKTDNERRRESNFWLLFLGIIFVLRVMICNIMLRYWVTFNFSLPFFAFTTLIKKKKQDDFSEPMTSFSTWQRPNRRRIKVYSNCYKSELTIRLLSNPSPFIILYPFLFDPSD